MTGINQSIQNYDDSLEKSKEVYSGILGLAIGGSKKVNVETRAGYVYVRLRDNLSEVIQAYNDKVSPVYDFPVLIERRGNKWYITGRDDQRYETFGTASPFLPQHGDAHSFNRDGGGGGDTVFVYPDQFVPLLVYPSGTFGAGNLMVAPYALQRTSDFVYVGNTGTQNLLVYKPTNAQAIVGLVYLDKTTGNPGVLIASGTPMSASPTGTAAILPYLPYPSSNQEPLYAFRLLSGTTSLTWSNLYNVRQFYGGSSSTSTGTSGGGISGIVAQDEGIVLGTGTVFNFVGSNVDASISGSVIRVFVTGSAGGSLPTFITGSIPFSAPDGTLAESNPNLRWDDTNKLLVVGRNFSEFITPDIYPINIVAHNQNESVALGGYVFGTGSSGAPSFAINGFRSRGGLGSPLPVQKGDAVLSLVGTGFDGASWRTAGRIRFYADNNFVTGSVLGTRMEFEVIPSGTSTRRTQLSIYGDSVNIPTGSTYNIGGTPHTHDTVGDWREISGTFTYASTSTINTPSDLTNFVQKGMPIRWKQGGGYKYGNVKGITSSLITILTNNDYTVANSAITDFAYSPSFSPVGFPESFSFTLGWSSDSNPQPSYGNATLSMWYKVISSGLYYYSAQAIFGSTTTMGTGLWRFSLPSAVTRSTTGNAFGIDVSAPTYVAGATIWDGSTKVLAMVGGTYAQPAAPFTWANGDYIGLAGTAPF